MSAVAMDGRAEEEAALQHAAADGRLRVELSDQTGLGEDTMTTFIRQHLASILQPFADHVDQLHKAVSQLEDHLTESKLVADDHSTELAHHAGLYAGLHKSLDATNLSVAQIYAKLEEHAVKNDKIQEDLNKARDHTKGVDEQHRTTFNSLLELQQEVKGTGFSIGKLKAEMAGIDQVITAKVNTVAEHLHVKHDTLDRAHAGTVDALRATTKLGEETHKAHQRFSQLSERHMLDHEDRLSQLDQVQAKLEVLIKNTSEHVQREAVRVEAGKALMAHLQARVEQTLKAQTVSENWQKDTTPKVRDLIGGLDAVSEKLEALISNLGATAGQNLGRVMDDISGLKASVGKNAGGIRDLERALDGQSQRISENQARATSLAAENVSLVDTLRAAEGRIKALIEKVEADRLEGEQRDAQADEERRRLNERCDGLSREMRATSARLQGTTEGLEAARGRVQDLEMSLSATGERVTKLSGSMDLTQEYWKGLARGFRETHRSVAVENELLPPPPRPHPLAGASSAHGPGGGGGGGTGLLPALAPASPKTAAAHGGVGGCMTAR